MAIKMLDSLYNILWNKMMDIKTLWKNKVIQFCWDGIKTFSSLGSCWILAFQFQFSRPVVSDSLGPHGLQHTRPPCPSPTAGVHPNSSSRWCHPAISSSVIPFSSCPQSLPASESFPMSQLFASGGKSIGVSASASVLPKNIQGWSPLG